MDTAQTCTCVVKSSDNVVVVHFGFWAYGFQFAIKISTSITLFSGDFEVACAARTHCNTQERDVITN